MHAAAVGRQHDPRGLAGDQRLEVDDRQQRRLDELRLDQRGRDAQERLVLEERRPLGHRPDVAREAQEPQDVSSKNFAGHRMKVGSARSQAISRA